MNKKSLYVSVAPNGEVIEESGFAVDRRTDLYGTSKNHKFRKGQEAFNQAKNYQSENKAKQGFVRKQAYNRGSAFEAKRSLQKAGSLMHDFNGNAEHDKKVRNLINSELENANQRINQIVFSKKGDQRRKVDATELKRRKAEFKLSNSYRKKNSGIQRYD